MKLIILHASFLQVDFNSLVIKVSYNWWAWSSILKVIKPSSLQYLYSISKKNLGMEFIFCMQINTSFYKLALSFLMEVTSIVQNTQNRKMVIFLQCIETIVWQLCFFSIVMQNIQIFYGDPVIFVTCFFSYIY